MTLYDFINGMKESQDSLVVVSERKTEIFTKHDELSKAYCTAQKVTNVICDTEHLAVVQVVHTFEY